MNASEIHEWGLHHKRLFPGWATWWDTLPGDVKAELGRQMTSIFGGIALQDALEASNRMLAGTVELCPAYERSMLASRIAAAAREIASDRAPRRPETSYRYRPSQAGDGPTAGEIYAEVLRRADLGEDPVTVARELIPPVEPEREPRYRCLKCRDSGLVWVWHNMSIRAFLAGDLQPRDCRTMTVACECSAGDRFCIADSATPPKGWRGWRESARYTPDRYCRCSRDPQSAEAMEDFTEWMEDYKQRMTRQMGNYSTELAAYGR